MHIAILGRQPALGLAELERRYGSLSVTAVGKEAAIVGAPVEPNDLATLGGSIKLAKVLTTLDTVNWHTIEKHLVKSIPKHLSYVPEGKMRIGLSVYGLPVKTDAINATGLRVKRLIKSAGRSVRVVPNKASSLNSAQVLHNQLTGPTGWELVFVRYGHKTILAQSVAEQDIDAYAARDQARPARDAFVGMLPPKLAQIMINLAHPKKGARLLDPFCGTGVILQEALLIEYSVYGTDLSEKMIDYSKRNLDWLSKKFDLHSASYDLSQADAMAYSWNQPIDAVVCEAYLGQPFSAPPSAAKLDEVRRNCNHIIGSFLTNIGSQITPGTPLCVAVPAWRSASGDVTRLPLINELEKLGYHRYTFKSVKDNDLLYYREDQVVARELLVIEKV